MLRQMLATTNDLTFTIARLVLGVTFFIHGAQKMLGWFGGAASTSPPGRSLCVGWLRPAASPQPKLSGALLCKTQSIPETVVCAPSPAENRKPGRGDGFRD
jgi:uncharacterized membrane protein YphA (DoxX/SURF4 family)